MSALSFNQVSLNPVSQPDNQIWITAVDLANALGYKKADAVTQIFKRNEEEFSSSMSLTLKMSVNGINNSLRQKTVRIFSLRGCHLVAMFAKTAVAKQFRKWVLDLIDNELKTPIQSSKLSESQKQQIKEAVNKRHHRTQESHQAIYLKLHALCKVSTYTEINATDFDLAIRFLNSIENSPVFKHSSVVMPTGQHIITDDDLFYIAYSAFCIQKMGEMYAFILPIFERLNSPMVGKIASYAQCYDNCHFDLKRMSKQLYKNASESTKLRLDNLLLKL